MGAVGAVGAGAQGNGASAEVSPAGGAVGGNPAGAQPQTPSVSSGEAQSCTPGMSTEDFITLSNQASGGQDQQLVNLQKLIEMMVALKLLQSM